MKSEHCENTVTISSDGHETPMDAMVGSLGFTAELLSTSNARTFPTENGFGYTANFKCSAYNIDGNCERICAVAKLKELGIINKVKVNGKCMNGEEVPAPEKTPTP